jgi:hypothetical protein
VISTQDRDSADSADGTASSGRPAAGTRSRPRPQHAPELAHLTLTELRAYRQELVTEEIRVSYWRRILQARLDTTVGRTDERTPAPKLQSVLSQHQESSRRLAVHPVHDAAGVPPLPDLTVLWESGAGTAEDPVDDALVVRLAAAEVELSAYRRALHERLDDATSELIARYREKPALALCALPLPTASDVA